MVDLFSLALTHALMALAAWRLLLRDDLDSDPEPESVPDETCAPGGAPGPEGGVPRLQRPGRGARGRA